MNSNKHISKDTKHIYKTLLTNVTKYVGNWPVNTDFVASGQYSCPRINTTVLGHNTGLISKHPFNNTII